MGVALLEMIRTTRRMVEHFDRPSVRRRRQMLETISWILSVMGVIDQILSHTYSSYVRALIVVNGLRWCSESAAQRAEDRGTARCSRKLLS
jgi:hypothetical protein